MYGSVAYEQVKTRLLESEVEAEEPTNHKAENWTFFYFYFFIDTTWTTIGQLKEIQKIIQKVMVCVTKKNAQKKRITN